MLPLSHRKLLRFRLKALPVISLGKRESKKMKYVRRVDAYTVIENRRFYSFHLLKC